MRYKLNAACNEAVPTNIKMYADLYGTHNSTSTGTVVSLIEEKTQKLKQETHYG